MSLPDECLRTEQESSPGVSTADVPIVYEHSTARRQHALFLSVLCFIACFSVCLSHCDLKKSSAMSEFNTQLIEKCCLGGLFIKTCEIKLCLV